MEWSTGQIPTWVIESGQRILICREGESDIELAAFVKVGYENDDGDPNAYLFCVEVYGQDYALLTAGQWYVSTKKVEAWMLAPDRYKSSKKQF
jgi:hypothetical protein